MIYLFGNNSVAESIYDELTSSGVTVNSIVVDDEYIDINSRSSLLEVLPFSKLKLCEDDVIINCVGYSNLKLRVEIGQRFEKTGSLGTFISKSANIANTVTVAKGSVILGNATIERNVVIGKSCLIWGGARICHDSVLENGVFLAAGSIVGGGCIVGGYTSVGFNSSIKEYSVVPSETKVGANRFFHI